MFRGVSLCGGWGEELKHADGERIWGASWLRWSLFRIGAQKHLSASSALTG
jgi:hypothetical protein